MIKAEEATRRAQYRLMKVFKSKLQDEADPLNDTNNTLPLPLDTGYYVAGSDEDMTKLLNADVNCCFIVPTGPSVVTAPRSGDGNVRGKLYTTVFRVTFLFKKYGAYETYTVEGKPATYSELMYHTADRIRGAALLAVHKYAVDTDNINAVDILTQYADIVVVENNKLVGRAILEVSVLQNIEIPMPTYDAL